MRLAHEIALESRGRLSAVAVDLLRHPDLVERWRVTTVPFFVLDGRLGKPGPLSELPLLQWLAVHAGSGPGDPAPPADSW